MSNELFESYPIPKAFFKLALPLVVGMVLSLVYNIVDTYFIAKTQNTNLVAGVSLCAPLFMLTIALGDIFGLGGSSVISRLFGQKKDEEGKRVCSFCFYGSILCGAAVTILLLIFRTPILYLFGANSETLEYASQYYFYLSLGAPITLALMTLGNILRTEGLSMASMAGTITGAITNIILDPIFIFGLNMGAAGAAIATVLGNLTADIVLILLLLKKSQKLSISIKQTRISASTKRGIFAIGIPASVTNIMQSFSIIMTNRYLIAYGTEKVAAMGIAMKINTIAVLIMVGFAFGAQPLLGYNYGAGNKKRLKQIIRFDLLVGAGTGLLISGVLTILAPQIIRLLMDDDIIVAAGVPILRWLLLTAPLIGIILVYTTLFQAMGKAWQSLILSLSRQGIIFAVCLLTLSRAFGYTGILSSQPAADAITAALAVTLYLLTTKRPATK